MPTRLRSKYALALKKQVYIYVEETGVLESISFRNRPGREKKSRADLLMARSVQPKATRLI